MLKPLGVTFHSIGQVSSPTFRQTELQLWLEIGRLISRDLLLWYTYSNSKFSDQIPNFGFILFFSFTEEELKNESEHFLEAYQFLRGCYVTAGSVNDIVFAFNFYLFTRLFS